MLLRIPAEQIGEFRGSSTACRGNYLPIGAISVGSRAADPGGCVTGAVKRRSLDQASGPTVAR